MHSPLADLLQQRAVYITRHTVDRLQLHVPTVETWQDVVPHLLASTEVAPEVARAMLQRHPPPKGTPEGRYFLAQDGQGLFAGERPMGLRPGRAHMQLVIVTYLRFTPSQQALALRLYPAPDSSS